MNEVYEHEMMCKELYNVFGLLKEWLKKKDSYLYEQWKAGGYLVDSDVVSMYPTLFECFERLADEETEIE